MHDLALGLPLLSLTIPRSLRGHRCVALPIAYTIDRIKLASKAQEQGQMRWPQ